jgi:hypothetical protein
MNSLIVKTRNSTYKLEKVNAFRLTKVSADNPDAPHYIAVGNVAEDSTPRITPWNALSIGGMRTSPIVNIEQVAAFIAGEPVEDEPVALAEECAAAPEMKVITKNSVYLFRKLGDNNFTATKIDRKNHHKARVHIGDTYEGYAYVVWDHHLHVGSLITSLVCNLDELKIFLGTEDS